MVVDGIVGHRCRGRAARGGGRRGRGGWPTSATGAARRWWSAWTCRAGSMWTRVRWRDRPCGPTSPSPSAASSPRWWSGRPRCWPARSTWSTSGCRGSRRRPRSGCPTPPTSAAGGRGRRPSSDKYTRGRGRPGHRLAGVPGRGADVGGRRAGRAGRDGPLRRARWPTTSPAATRRSWCPTGWPTPAGCRPGCAAAALGTDERAQDELRAVLGSSVPVVLDADALTMLGDGALASWLRRAGRADRGDAARPRVRPGRRRAGRPGPGGRRPPAGRAARRTVLLKGDRTVVATPDGTAWANPTGIAALARPAPGTCWPGCWCRCSPPGCRPTGRPSRPRSCTGWPAGGRRPGSATGAAPVTAADVAAALPEVIASLSANDRIPWTDPVIVTRGAGYRPVSLGSCGRRRCASTSGQSRQT